MTGKRTIMNEKEISLTLKRMTHEILEKTKNSVDLAVIGIQTSGVYLARRICGEIEKITGKKLPFGVLDITLYRDDTGSIAEHPKVRETSIPFNVDDKVILLVDDVLYAGRTVRAALDCLIDFGRPRAIMLAVLIDRGLRELPIRADFVGKEIATTHKETVAVELKEGGSSKDKVVLMRNVTNK